MKSNLISALTILLLVAVDFSGGVVVTADDSNHFDDDNLLRRMLKKKRKGRRKKLGDDGGFLEKSFKSSSKTKKKSFRIPRGSEKGSKTKKQKSLRIPKGSREEEIDANDSGHRYQKFEMYKNKDKPIASYPLSQELSKFLRYYSNVFSLVTSDDYEVKGRDVKRYIEKVGGYPFRPGTEAFWREFKYVCQVQLDRREGKLPKNWTAPDLWANDNVTTVAEHVHDEYPGDNQAALLFSWFANRKDIQLDYKILPFRCIDDFIGTEVRLAAILSWSIRTVAPVNFCAKWHVGQLRPEEMAWKIATGSVTDAPEDIHDMVMAMNLTKATDFTQYPEGCPNHPSWPAMHSAASSMSLWLAVVANLTKEQYCQVLLMDYAVSFARTIAGVHYVRDNIDGLNMGQEVIAEELTEYLVEVYGAKANAVKKKIEKFRFDWNNFDPVTCNTYAY